MAIRIKRSLEEVIDREGEPDRGRVVPETGVEPVVAAASGEQALSVDTETDAGVVADGLVEVVEMEDELLGVENAADGAQAHSGLGGEGLDVVDGRLAGDELSHDRAEVVRQLAVGPLVRERGGDRGRLL